ncbi:MAG: protein-glutamate O-methyltransferase CheR [Geminicoccaceae bacterium]|nr:protein-glutamate O-methyltransferase CheR [Geminicoccaceae bacterium]MCB9945562.1 protein-glutamate O-methyltransferase CheR [Geminicoccaceae bacterium]
MAIAAPPREFILTDRDFTDIAKLVHDIAGIFLAPSKRQLVYTRLSKRLRILGLYSFRDYIDRLEGPDGDDELSFLLNAITTNLTSFFREVHHFDHMRGELGSRLKGGSVRRLRIWSSACSTGEEPYSIAITLARTGIHKRAIDAKILATDIDTNVLARARAATYPLEAFKTMTSSEIRDFTVETGRGDAGGERRIAPDVARLVHCKQLNLMHDWPMTGPFDFIFCRNVLIYFDAPTKAMLIGKFTDLLAEGGYLYLGHSESLVQQHPGLRLIGRTTYRRMN